MTDIKYKSEYIGRGGISARVVAHSKSAYSGQEIITWEYEMPKCILAELNTHRVFSRNAQSSRAVPIAKVIDQIRNNPVTPVYWGSNQPGMVAGEEIETSVDLSCLLSSAIIDRDEAWLATADAVADLMEAWDKAGYHKQIVNRIGEAFTFVRGVITTTESDNFFHLRIHPAADPFMKEVAECLYQAYVKSIPDMLGEGEWHTPYVEHDWDDEGNIIYIHDYSEPDCFYLLPPIEEVTLERALEISAAACAQVSFRKLDLSDETVDRVYSRLVDDETPHSSCCEHQASPIKNFNITSLQELREIVGASHVDTEGFVWSGNFKSFIQNRKLIPNESCKQYKRKY